VNTTLAKWMSIILAATFMFTPLLAYADSLHQSAVREVVYEAAKAASIEGRFTDEIVEQMEETLSDHYNFDLDKVEIEVTQSLTYRPALNDTLTDADYLKATVTFPAIPVFFILFPNDDREHKVHVEILSEYIG